MLDLMGGISASRSAKFGVAVSKTSMLNWGVGGGRSAIRSAKFGVVVFEASMLNLMVVDLPVDLPSLV